MCVYIYMYICVSIFIHAFQRVRCGFKACGLSPAGHGLKSFAGFQPVISCQELTG